MGAGERSIDCVADTSINSHFCIDRPLSEVAWNPIIRVPQEILTPLVQVRDVFEEIDVLADSIARRRLLHPLNVGYLDREHCENYLRRFNHFWHTGYQLSDIVSVQGVEGTFYCPIIAGGRRNAAITYLKTQGCTLHQQQFGKIGCYHLHVPDQMVQVTLEPNISFDEAFEIQMSENSHMRVSSQREANIIEAYFRSRREENPNFKPSDVARELGRSIGFVTRALRYVEAPIQIQRAVEEGTLPYSVACEVARLKEVATTEEQLLWASKWDRKKYRGVDAFAKAITGEILRRKNGQMTMLSVFFTEGELDDQKEVQRRNMLRRSLGDLTEVTNDLRLIGNLYEAGVCDKSTLPYSQRVAVEAHLRAIRFMKPWLSKLEDLALELAKRGENQKVQRIHESLELAQQTERILEEIESRLPVDSGHKTLPQPSQLVFA